MPTILSDSPGTQLLSVAILYGATSDISQLTSVGVVIT
jgi:hypothetical protein